MKEKIFRDPVHGYISIPAWICDDFIDRDIFQRLRNIEQTSIRTLYPAASHDRFSHSLGVYHLGRLAFDKLKQNCANELSKLKAPDVLKSTFLLSCLLHDCGHAPFSHSLERYYYVVGKKHREKKLYQELINLVGNDDFEKDFNARPSWKEHEVVSSIVLYKNYKKDLLNNQADPELAVRMIIGCQYGENKLTNDNKIKNVFISLLNGKVFDVDKLDYVMRDSYVGGINNVSIDVYRLLSSLRVTDLPNNTHKTIAFDKSAISVIRSLIEGNIFLSAWVHNHHVVQYNQYLLRTSIEKTLGMRETYRLFDIKSFCDKNHKHYLPCDGDIVHLLKTKIDYNKDNEAKEFLSRRYSHVALWKTFAEFQSHFDAILNKKIIKYTALLTKKINGLTDDDRVSIKRNSTNMAIGELNDEIEEILISQGLLPVKLKVSIKKYREWESGIWLIVNNNPIKYSSIYGNTPSSLYDFCYFYIKVEGYSYTDRITEKKKVIALIKEKLKNH